MKRMTTEEKKAELNRYCRKHDCRACQLVVTAFCQNNDTSDEAVNEAYKVYSEKILGRPMAAPTKNP
mgnify:CR=1 FL=1